VGHEEGSVLGDDARPYDARMTATTPSVEQTLDLAIRHFNAGQADRAQLLCEHAVATHPPHAAVLQLLALLCMKDGQLDRAKESIAQSLALRVDHGPTLLLAGDIDRARGDVQAALASHARAVEVIPDRADAWFALALDRQDVRDFAGAASALQRVRSIAPPRAEVEVNLGIVLQESGRIDEAMRAYGRAYRLNDGTFGRIAHALSTPNAGRLWLNLDDLRMTLSDAPSEALTSEVASDTPRVS
jgi:tetratricopeptide (TPR) repeat protein